MTMLYAVLLAAGVVLLVVTTVRVLVGGLEGSGPDRVKPQTPTGGSRGRRILDERYAAGELSTEEYQHRLSVLEEGDS